MTWIKLGHHNKVPKIDAGKEGSLYTCGNNTLGKEAGPWASQIVN